MSTEEEKQTAARRLQVLWALSLHNGHSAMPAKLRNDMDVCGYPMFQLSHDGFAILAMSFTGKAALEWKVRFLEAFRAMERALAEREARYVRALDVVRPYLRPVAEATERGESRTLIGERLEKSANAVTYHRRRARELGILERKAA